MRKSEILRKTGETDIKLNIELDGTGKSEIKTGCGFMDHMLTLFAKHGRFDLDVSCIGDCEVDYHHSVEDIGICLGKAFSQALGNCAGITRYADIVLPMDEALVMCAVDICGRDTLVCKLDIPTTKVGDFDTELVEEFLIAFVRNAKLSLHIRQLEGRNSHHIIEAVFKALGRTLGKAIAIDAARADEIPSTKGVI
ncbi:MAG: imidazoleglycerol-phosphate dehydratase HisB [Ruminococcaceae bacterium]|nr:imidazoleglycerol-phosphate dehydratase HisB [Oscillospiraceae bacterium]